MAEENKNENLEAEEKLTKKADKIVAEENFEKKTQERMEKVFEEDLSTPDEDSEIETDTETDTETDSIPGKSDDKVTEPEKDSTSQKSDDDSAETDTETDTDTETETETDTADKDKDKVELPDAYYRAALHQEWTPDEIAGFFKEKPELAIKTFKKMYESTNRSSRDFAAIGRIKVEGTKVVKPEVKPDASKETSTFKKIDIAELRKKYPDDEMIDFFEQIQTQNEEMSKRLESIVTNQPVQLDTERETLKREIEETQRTETKIIEYFASKDLKPYGEFYGVLPKGYTSWYDGLTKQQQDNRFNVITTANYIMEGAKESGIEISAEDAMNRAHLVASESVREQIIRDNLKKKAVKKEKGLTLKPKGVQRSADTKVKTRSDFEKVTAQRMKKTFGN